MEALLLWEGGNETDLESESVRDGVEGEMGLDAGEAVWLLRARIWSGLGLRSVMVEVGRM
jgi:hypothetical protein